LKKNTLFDDELNRAEKERKDKPQKNASEYLIEDIQSPPTRSIIIKLTEKNLKIDEFLT
jgi:hypothetical protein